MVMRAFRGGPHQGHNVIFADTQPVRSFRRRRGKLREIDVLFQARKLPELARLHAALYQPGPGNSVGKQETV